MIKISSHIFLQDSELEFTFIRSPGPGGQNVNKVASAVQLRFNVPKSSLPEQVKTILVANNKITNEGDLIIKASRYRTQERNKHDAIHRLISLILIAATPRKKRKKTRPTMASKERRLEKKKFLGKTKLLRRKIRDD